MTVLRAIVTLNNDASLAPRDAAVNTWHFASSSPSSGATDALTQLTTFYNAIDTHLSSAIDGTANVAIYNLADEKPRVPILEGTISLSLGSGTGFPNEVACCLSYRGPLGSGVNIRRNRGRIYLGPLDIDGGTQNSGDNRPSSTLRSNIINASEVLALNAGNLDATWCVFSPTTAGSEPWSEGTLDASSFLITHTWCDDAFDTVRSRGLASNNRTTWTAP